MRKILPAILLLGLAACAPSRWEKPGGSETTTARDSVECRKAARSEAMRYYSQPPPQPFAGAIGPSPYIGMRAGSSNVWQYSTTEPGPYALEESLTSSCMRKRGYDRVAVPQQT